MISKEREEEIRVAYAEMQKRGWGFTSNGNGFGDPKATMTAVGPFDGVLVNVIAFDADAVKAVQKAIDATEAI